MTIDEAIEEEKEMAKEQKTKYDKCPTRMKYCCEMCFHNPKCNEVAEYHEQIAEWLEELKSYRAHIFSGDMTQKMLKEKYNNGWIPCSERLPEDDSICIVTVEYPSNKTMVDYGWFDRKSVCWFVGMQDFRTSNILAWQPLPEPFKESD